MVQRDDRAAPAELSRVLAAAAETGDDAVSVTDPAGRILYANAAAASLLGRAGEPLAGHTVFDLEPALDAGRWAANWAAIRAAGRLTGERTTQGRTGPVTIENSATLVRVDGCEYCVSTMRDVSARKRAEAVALAEARLRGLSTRINEIELVFLPDGRIVEANDRAVEAYGWTRDELLGQDVRVLRHPATRGQVDAQLRRAEQGEGLRFETVHLRRDDTSFPVEVSTRAFTVAGEVFLHSLVRDLTEQRQAEAALRESEARLARVLEGTDEGFWDWDVPSGHVTFSRRWAEMLGYALEELPPHVSTWERLVHPEDTPAIREVLEAHFRGERPVYETEHRVRHRDGTWRWILDRGKVVARDPDGRPLRMAGTHTDVTERRRAQDATRAALAENERLVAELREALQRVRTLSGLLPVCAWCHKVREDSGYWSRLEEYVSAHTDATVTHGLCPECLTRHFPGEG